MWQGRKLWLSENKKKQKQNRNFICRDPMTIAWSLHIK